MMVVLAWLLLARMALSKPGADLSNIASTQQNQAGDTTSNVATTFPRRVEPPEQPGDGPSIEADVNKREELPPGTKSYSAWITDRENEKQINDTRIWLEGLVKDKSKMYMWKGFTWESAADVPDDELDKLIDEGRYEAEIDKYKRVGGFTGLILDQQGYEAVAQKKEWIRHIYEPGRDVAMSPVPSTAKPLTSRKFEWGDWDKQESAVVDLVEASRYE
jgi:hypothetical protein